MGRHGGQHAGPTIAMWRGLVAGVGKPPANEPAGWWIEWDSYERPAGSSGAVPRSSKSLPEVIRSVIRPIRSLSSRVAVA